MYVLSPLEEPLKYADERFSKINGSAAKYEGRNWERLNAIDTYLAPQNLSNNRHVTGSVYSCLAMATHRAEIAMPAPSYGA